MERLKIQIKNQILVGAIIFFAGLLFAGTLSIAHAQMGMMGSVDQSTTAEHDEDLNTVLADILAKQNKQTADQLDCSQISDDDFESLGDAWMGVMHPDQEVHERMDQMMGGEGSASLRQAHINMGKSYLRCGGNYGMMGMGQMMGGGSFPVGRGGGNQMMGYGWNGASQMMGFSGLSGFGGIFGLVNGLLVMVLLAVLIRYFWNKGGKK